MVDAPGAEAALGDLEAAAFAQQDVADRHTDVVEEHLDVAMRRVVVPHDIERAHDAQPGCVGRHEHHALLRVAGGVRIGLAHHDEDRAARIGGAGDPPFVAVDDVVVTLALDAGGDVGGVAGSHLGFGHRERRPDPALEQGLEPAGLALLRPVAGDGLHVAGVGRRAVEHLAGPRYPTHDLGQRRVFLVGEAGAGVTGCGGTVDRQKQVPQPGGLCQGFECLDGLQGCPAPAGQGVGLELLAVGGFCRVDVLVHELLQLGLQFLGLGRIGEIHGDPPEMGAFGNR